MHRTHSSENQYTQALLECLRSSPLLVDNLPEAVCLDRGKFFSRGKVSIDLPELNFSQKLGHLYEDALAYLIEQSSDLELLGKSVQVFSKKRITLGELDYVMKDLVGGGFINLELAVKFYLVRYEDGEPYYPGPDPRDNWLNKLKRMREHQLQLIKSDEAKSHLLDAYGISKIDTQHLIVGKLFDHYLAEERPCPPAMRADCQRGKWKYLSEWLRDSDVSDVKVISKCLWPAKVEDILDGIESITRQNFINEVQERCTMIWDEDEQAALFIASDSWGEDV